MNKKVDNLNPYGVDWSDVDLSSPKVDCNLREITSETVMQQFEEDLRCRVDEARMVMRDNLESVVKYAREYCGRDEA